MFYATHNFVSLWDTKLHSVLLNFECAVLNDCAQLCAGTYYNKMQFNLTRMPRKQSPFNIFYTRLVSIQSSVCCLKIYNRIFFTEKNHDSPSCTINMDVLYCFWTEKTQWISNYQHLLHLKIWTGRGSFTFDLQQFVFFKP